MFDTSQINDSSSFQDLFDSVLDGLGESILILDREFKIIYANRRYASQLGKSMDEVKARYCYEIYYQINKPCSDEGHECPALVTFKIGQPARAIHNHFNANGKEIFIEVNTYPVKDKNGKVAQVIETTRDITEERKVENELDWTREFLYNLIQNSGDAIMTLDLDLKITSWNRAAEKIYGRTGREMLGKSLPAILKDQASETVAVLEKVKKGETVSNFEAVRRRKNGDLVTVNVTYSPILDTEGTVIGISIISRDITERKQAEEALQQSERRYRGLFENAYDVIFTLDLNGFITSVNEAGTRVSGYTRGELVGMNISRLLPPEELLRARDGLQMAARGEGLSPSFEYEIIRKDGSRATLELGSRPILEGGKVTGFHSIARDMTEKKILQQKIAESERYLKDIIESTSDAIIALDAKGNIVLFNDGSEKIFGYRREELIGKNIVEGNEVKFYRDIDTASHVMRKMKESNDGKISNLEVMGKTKDGREIYISVSASLLKNEMGEIIGSLGVTKDITERKQIEDELKKKIKELEEFYNMAMGRELKMIELKKEITSLREKLKEKERG